ncbi:MAG TPA: FAD-dependent monooxygenase [Candidatus Binataceae bacterium]|nr:FAD-dependent monooxygenase [Candidatus Binataceae bacterium]
MRRRSLSRTPRGTPGSSKGRGNSAISTSRGKRAIVIGGSLGGLFAGCFLHRAGWQVSIFERSRENLASRGAGLGITKELAEALGRAQARLEPSLAVAINSSVWLDGEGRVVWEHRRSSTASAWSRIYLPLRAAVSPDIYHPATSLLRVEQTAGGVVAVFADGSRATADLLIAADGNQSTVRRQYMPEVQPCYAGYVAWRGTMEEGDIPAILQRQFFDKLTFSFPPGEMALAMPVPGAGDDMRPGHRRYYFIWYRPTPWERVKELCTATNGEYYGMSIPPPLIRPEFVAEVKQNARALFAPALATVIERTAQPFLQPITDMVAPRLVMGRVALVGDAGSVARPHVAAGATKAALDAACLVDALSSRDDIDAALADYERGQHEFGEKMVAHGRYLGAYLEGQLKPPAMRGAGQRERDPIRLISDYGAPHLVHNLEMKQLEQMARQSGLGVA